MIDPNYIASLLTSDPDILNEDLFGYTVRGNKPIDEFISMISDNYTIEWGINNKKFQKWFQKFFPETDINELPEMIENSSQQKQLKQILIQKLGKEKIKIPTSEKGRIIKDKDGKILYQSKKTDLKRALEEAVYSDIDLSNANLSHADLSNTDLSNANLNHADLSNADLEYVYFINANLRNANLNYANLSYANLSYADLSYVDAEGVDFDSAIITGVKW